MVLLLTPWWAAQQDRKYKPLPFIIEQACEFAFIGYTFKKAQIVMVVEGEVLLDFGLLFPALCVRVCCLLHLTLPSPPLQFKGFVGVVISNAAFNSSGKITLSKLSLTEFWNKDELEMRLEHERTVDYGLPSHVGLELFLRHEAGCGHGFMLALHELKSNLLDEERTATRLRQEGEISQNPLLAKWLALGAQEKWDRLSRKDKEIWGAGNVPARLMHVLRKKTRHRDIFPKKKEIEEVDSEEAEEAEEAEEGGEVGDKDSSSVITVAAELAVRLMPVQSFGSAAGGHFCQSTSALLRRGTEAAAAAATNSPGGERAVRKDRLTCICRELFEDDPASFYQDQESLFEHVVRSLVPIFSDIQMPLSLTFGKFCRVSATDILITISYFAIHRPAFARAACAILGLNPFELSNDLVIAFAMSQHSRLGSESTVKSLSSDLILKITREHASAMDIRDLPRLPYPSKFAQLALHDAWLSRHQREWPSKCMLYPIAAATAAGVCVCAIRAW